MLTTEQQENVTAGHFVYVDYDISDKSERDSARDELKGEGFAMRSESVYISVFSEVAYDAAERIAQKYGIGLTITTPVFPSEEQRQRVMAQYEKAFEQSFEAVDNQLVFVEEALSRDRLYTDKKTGAVRPYSKEQLIRRLNDVERDISELESVLDNDGKLSPQLAQFAVRQARNVAKTYLEKNLERK
jgi:hypothetical protein